MAEARKTKVAFNIHLENRFDLLYATRFFLISLESYDILEYLLAHQCIAADSTDG